MYGQQLGSPWDDLKASFQKEVDKIPGEAEKAAQTEIQKQLAQIGIVAPAAPPKMVTIAGKPFPMWMVYVGGAAVILTGLALLMKRKRA